MKTKRCGSERNAGGFTLVELLVVIGIIGILLSILVPTVNVAIVHSKNTSMRATLHAIAMGLDQFRNDFGSYPESDPTVLFAIDSSLPYRGTHLTQHTSFLNTGAHLLAEAMVGEDNLGYNSNHGYYINNDGIPSDHSGNPVKRWGPYVSVENMKIGTMPQAFETLDTSKLLFPDLLDERVWENNMNSVLLDTFNSAKPLPIVYFKANSRGRSITPNNANPGIYNFADNERILSPFGMASPLNIDQYPDVSALPTSPTEWNYGGYKHTLLQCFPYYIWDHKSEGMTPWLKGQWAARPYNPDTFILMTAGHDGIYGTEDDICNFELRK